MNIFRKVYQGLCHHEWEESDEELIFCDDGATQDGTIVSKWTCKKCGKVSWANPHK
jgi:hypothetical protein